MQVATVFAACSYRKAALHQRAIAGSPGDSSQGDWPMTMCRCRTCVGKPLACELHCVLRVCVCVCLNASILRPFGYLGEFWGIDFHQPTLGWGSVAYFFLSSFSSVLLEPFDCFVLPQISLWQITWALTPACLGAAHLIQSLLREKSLRGRWKLGALSGRVLSFFSLLLLLFVVR